MINPKVLKQSFIYAKKGFWYVFKNEQNFRLQILISFVMICLMLFLKVSKKEFVLLIIIIMNVLALEMINTAMEKLVDMLKPRIHFYAEIVKNIMAAVVLTVSIGAVIIGTIVLWPYVYPLMF
jgi:diacylglycerol kinase